MDIAMEPAICQSFPEQRERTDILMEAKIWQALPEDLLLMVLARLPMRVLAKMRTVSRKWNELLSFPDALQRIDLNLPVHSFPGFLFQLAWAREHIVETWVIEYLGGDSSDMNIYKAPLPRDIVIVDACRNIYCSHRRGDRMHLSIGNLATWSCRRLPCPHPLLQWSFIAMDFDATTKRYTVLLGENNDIWGQPDGNRMVMQIYDSESNVWTMVAGTVLKFICPIGKGIFSKGKVYWIISWDGTNRMIGFTIADGRWEEIGLPQGCGCDCHPKRFALAGCDGRVVLMIHCYDHLCIHMWNLKEQPNSPEWCEPNSIWMPGGPNFYRAEANRSGWTMMFEDELKISLCNPKRRLRRSIILPFPSPVPDPSRVFMSAFESNNIYLP